LQASVPDEDATWYGPVRVAGGSTLARLALRSDGRNPFRSASSLRYLLPGTGVVRLTIRNLQGSVVRTLVDAVEQGGPHIATWDGRNDAGHESPAGIYLARLEHGRETRTVKLIRTR
jgi:hypothetical protein